MFTQVPQPLVYAEALLAQFASLSRAADGAALLGDFVRGVAELSGCELTQLYLLDATHTCLGMNAECLNGILQPREAASLPADYNGEQLLQFALCQNRVVSLSELSGSLHETSFLPPQATPWQSLLCVPMVNQQKAVEGLLLCASRRHIDLQGFAGSLGQLGSFVLGQLHLLQRLRQPIGDTRPAKISIPSASGYGLIGKSKAMRQTYSLISKVLHSPYTVLLRGETGTGKEVVARAIHDCGPRRSQAFIVQNCAAFPENLLESELFGYRKGAFTGADRDRAGLFDAANGGTLLLDEIGDMPLSLQAKLLRVLQEGEIRPLGSNDTHKIDVRIIAATHRDLSVLVSEANSARTCTTASRNFRSSCRPCVSAKATSSTWPGTSPTKLARFCNGMRCVGPTRRWITCPVMPSPATFANSKVWSNARCCCAKAASCWPSISPCAWKPCRRTTV